ncbi:MULTISPECIES: hypothetical protein [Bacillus subtilis group]|nr:MULTISPECIES: hypothetical protein [Bacillus subtilis group]MEC0927857.1 hypothetical protein [Bacillus atrophaeus]
MKIKWLVHTFVTVFITMVFMWMIKKASAKYQIPVVSKIAAEV